jgi:hypothetical protein
VKGGSGPRRHELGGSGEARSRPSKRVPQIAVIGSGHLELDSEVALLAEEVGRRLAEAGATVVCGGLGGVMEAASRGASRAGGEWGTLSEIGHARTFDRTVVALRSWGLTGREKMEGAPGVIPADTPEEAVAAALDAIRS